MAPLKPHPGSLEEEMNVTYPWLKGHGSFEASTVSAIYDVAQVEYPWLKGHGSFEAHIRKIIYEEREKVSMAERSWLL